MPRVGLRFGKELNSYRKSYNPETVRSSPCLSASANTAIFPTAHLRLPSPDILQQSSCLLHSILPHLSSLPPASEKIRVLQTLRHPKRQSPAIGCTKEGVSTQYIFSGIMYPSCTLPSGPPLRNSLSRSGMSFCRSVPFMARELLKQRHINRNAIKEKRQCGP